MRYSLKVWNGQGFEVVETGPRDVVLADGHELSWGHGFAITVEDFEGRPVPCGFGTIGADEGTARPWTGSDGDWSLIDA